MAIFEDVTLTFKGKEYTVPAGQVMKLICKLSDSISLQELTRAEGPRLPRLAEAYTVALNYAGAKVTLEQVYVAMFGSGSQAQVAEAVTGLICMMIPPEHFRAAAAEDDKGSESGNDQPQATNQET